MYPSVTYLHICLAFDIQQYPTPSHLAACYSDCQLSGEGTCHLGGTLRIRCQPLTYCKVFKRKDWELDTDLSSHSTHAITKVL